MLEFLRYYMAYVSAMSIHSRQNNPHLLKERGNRYFDNKRNVLIHSIKYSLSKSKSNHFLEQLFASLMDI